MMDIFHNFNIYSLSTSSADALTPLNAFDLALLRSDVGNVNLVKISSILPPSCKYQLNLRLPLGALVPVAYASITSSKEGQTIASAVSVAIPKDPKLNGLIMEYSSVDSNKETVEDVVTQMARWGMEKRGYEIDKIISIGSEHTVRDNGCTFACVILWHS
ncbi:MAG: arginine decarboxylase, pyruvoyl-dependent [Conexivisphaerales archaeon]